MRQSLIMRKVRNWWCLAPNINDLDSWTNSPDVHFIFEEYDCVIYCTLHVSLTAWTHRIKRLTEGVDALVVRTCTVEPGDHPQIYVWHMHLLLLTEVGDRSGLPPEPLCFTLLVSEFTCRPPEDYQTLWKAGPALKNANKICGRIRVLLCFLASAASATLYLMPLFYNLAIKGCCQVLWGSYTCFQHCFHLPDEWELSKTAPSIYGSSALH